MPGMTAQTGFSVRGVRAQYDYTLRRKALRSSWFPDNKEALRELSEKHGLIVRFVIGHSSIPEQERAITMEERQYGGFLRLPIQAWRAGQEEFSRSRYARRKFNPANEAWCFNVFAWKMQEAYLSLAQKTLTFFKLAVDLYDVPYVVKVRTGFSAVMVQCCGVFLYQGNGCTLCRLTMMSI